MVISLVCGWALPRRLGRILDRNGPVFSLNFGYGPTCRPRAALLELLQSGGNWTVAAELSRLTTPRRFGGSSRFLIDLDVPSIGSRRRLTGGRLAPGSRCPGSVPAATEALAMLQPPESCQATAPLMTAGTSTRVAAPHQQYTKPWPRRSTRAPLPHHTAAPACAPPSWTCFHQPSRCHRGRPVVGHSSHHHPAQPIGDAHLHRYRPSLAPWPPSSSSPPTPAVADPTSQLEHVPRHPGPPAHPSRPPLDPSPSTMLSGLTTARPSSCSSPCRRQPPDPATPRPRPRALWSTSQRPQCASELLPHRVPARARLAPARLPRHSLDPAVASSTTRRAPRHGAMMLRRNH